MWQNIGQGGRFADYETTTTTLVPALRYSHVEIERRTKDDT
jgi:hypothetical protein